MKYFTKAASFITAATLLFGAMTVPGTTADSVALAASESIESQMEIDTLNIGGGGFVSGIVTGQKEMYLRTDVGGAYKYDYTKNRWVQLFAFLNENDRGLLSVKGIAIDPTDDNTVYFLCGCAYFSDARTVIFKTTDGGKTFTQSDVTDLIQVHGNGDGRECIEPIAVDPDNTDIIYAGGDVTAGDSGLIKSTDGGATWEAVKGYDDLGLFTESLKYPMWTEHMVRGTESKEYNQQNGIGCVLIEDGKVYVGTSVTGQTNIHVADVDKDEFTELSADLPTANYPVSITSDNNGHLYFTYIAGLAFSGAAGGAYKYDLASGDVKKLSVTDNAVGMIDADKTDPNKLVARTCGMWSDQWFEEEWTDDSIAWGDHFFRSTDGGETWENITPGQGETIYDANGSHKEFVSLPMSTNGYDWIYGKACHWGSGIVIDPRNSDRILMTSGNGVYACDNTWDEKGVQFYFQPDGVEEVVALDMVSAPGRNPFSAIGDYDGFEHVDKMHGLQHSPNMGSTSAIAYCPSNPDVMVRASQNDSKTYYTLDCGKTWTEMNGNATSGKAAITELEDGTYRIFRTGNGSGSYTDDFGATWNDCTGLDGSKELYFKVDDADPKYVYGYTAKYNDYWFYDTSKKEPTFEDAHYVFMVSDDYGATFTKTDVCKYDQCDAANRIGYLGEGEMVVGAGWNGAYYVTDHGKSIEKLDSVFYCKTIGYGAPEKEGGLNTLYMYGQPTEEDIQGVYRSSDAGKTWVLINSNKLYGGTGNGNFLVGDMNTFGTVYMSTVGCGIVYMSLSNGQTVEPGTTTQPTTTTTTATKDSGSSETTTVTTTIGTTKDTTDTTTTSETTENSSTDSTTTTVTTTTTKSTGTTTSTLEDDPDVLYGDVNIDGKISVLDVVYSNKALANIITLNDQQLRNADCCKDGLFLPSDSSVLNKYIVRSIESLPVLPAEE